MDPDFLVPNMCAASVPPPVRAPHVAVLDVTGACAAAQRKLAVTR
jgi:hypothetical protein